MRAEGVMQTYQTGDSLIFKVPEREISLQPAALYPEAFPVAEAEAVIQPIALSIHSWVVQTPHDLIVIDTATGNGRERGGNPLYHQLNTPYLENLRAAGVNPEDVTLVLLTHLHTDHVGWNTVWQDDRWVPLFPNARYLCSAKELSRVKNSERYRALWLDSLLPVIEAGQLETVDVATRPRVGGRIDFIPTPGHSPDHAALVLAAGDDYACFSGDLLHSPIQFAHPQWNSAFCGDPRPSLVQFFGLGTGFAGLILLSVNQTASGTDSGWGILLVLCAAFGWVTGSFLSKKQASETQLSVIQTSGLLMFIGGLQSLVGAAVLGEFSTFSMDSVTPLSAGALLYLVIFGAIIAYTCYFWLLLHTRTVVAISYEYVNPVIGVFLGWLLAGEQVDGVIVTACCLTVLSVFFIVSRKHG
jgi:glyoxylase-like metal-dependent hydrolase (beta-lactamase superfamily II)